MIRTEVFLNREALKSEAHQVGKTVRKMHNKAFNRRCFRCGGVVVNDEKTGVWQCLNPECESQFREIP